MMILSAATRLGNSKSQMQDIGSIKAKIVVMILLLISLLFICEAQGQFYTKGSKAIPRMGRRSVPEEPQPIKIGRLYRRMLLDKLVDEYGPTAVAKMQEEANRASSSSESSSEELEGSVGGEIYESNDQPFDLNNMIEDRSSDDSGLLLKSRNERRAVTGDEGVGLSTSSPAHKTLRQRANSLAMRAFNTDRLLQHLASGGSPSLSYDHLGDDRR